MITKIVRSLAVAIPESAPIRIPVNATGLYFAAVPSPVNVQFDDTPDRIPLSAPQQILFGQTRVAELHIDNDNVAGIGDLIILAFTAGEMFAL